MSQKLSRISMHFERDVREAIRELGPKNKQNLLLAVLDFDNDDVQNRMRENTEKQQEKPATGNFRINYDQQHNKQNYAKNQGKNNSQKPQYNGYKDQRSPPIQQSHEISAITVAQQRSTEKHNCSGAYKIHNLKIAIEKCRVGWVQLASIGQKTFRRCICQLGFFYYAKHNTKKKKEYITKKILMCGLMSIR